MRLVLWLVRYPRNCVEALLTFESSTFRATFSRVSTDRVPRTSGRGSWQVGPMLPEHPAPWFCHTSPSLIRLSKHQRQSITPPPPTHTHLCLSTWLDPVHEIQRSYQPRSITLSDSTSRAQINHSFLGRLITRLERLIYLTFRGTFDGPQSTEAHLGRTCVGGSPNFPSRPEFRAPRHGFR